MNDSPGRIEVIFGRPITVISVVDIHDNDPDETQVGRIEKRWDYYEAF